MWQARGGKNVVNARCLCASFTFSWTGSKSKQDICHVTKMSKVLQKFSSIKRFSTINVLSCWHQWLLSGSFVPIIWVKVKDSAMLVKTKCSWHCIFCKKVRTDYILGTCWDKYSHTSLLSWLRGEIGCRFRTRIATGCALFPYFLFWLHQKGKT